MPDEKTPGPARAAGRAPGPACPICGKPRVEEWRPFCSKRCADVDLGRWLGGRYAIPGEPVDPGDLGPGEDAETDEDR
jgi:endogenous inhibitor of DNA gyrase (YacG/DUF329 family)